MSRVLASVWRCELLVPDEGAPAHRYVRGLTRPRQASIQGAGLVFRTRMGWPWPANARHGDSLRAFIGTRVQASRHPLNYVLPAEGMVAIGPRGVKRVAIACFRLATVLPALALSAISDKRLRANRRLVDPKSETWKLRTVSAREERMKRRWTV